MMKSSQEAKYLSKIKENPSYLSRIKLNQTETLCLEAVKREGMVLASVRQQTETICLEAVKQCGLALQFVKNQTHEMCEEAVKQNGMALQFVDKSCLVRPIETLYEPAILSSQGRAIQFIPQAEESLLLKAVELLGWNLRWIPKEAQTLAICLAAVKEDGEVLRHVKKQTPEICLEAVRENGKALKYVKHQTEELCWEAIRQHPLAIEFVKQQTEAMCQEAFERQSSVFRFLTHQTEAMCIQAIQKDINAIFHVKEQTIPIAVAVMKRDETFEQFLKVDMQQVYRQLMKDDPRYLTKVEDLTEQDCWEVIRLHPHILSDLSDSFQTERVCLEAVKGDGMALRHIQQPTEEMFLVAVRSNPDVKTFLSNDCDSEILFARVCRDLGFSFQQHRMDTVLYPSLKKKSLYDYLSEHGVQNQLNIEQEK